MRRYVRVFGSALGALVAAYGIAIVAGGVKGPIPCRTDCQLNESFRILLGESVAAAVIGMSWIVAGVALVVFINSKRIRQSATEVKRRRRR